MRAFLLGCVAFVAIGAAGYFVLNAVQQPSGAAYTTDGARIDPHWSWRTAANTPKTCRPRASWQWFFVDFGGPAGESSLCSDSQ